MTESERGVEKVETQELKYSRRSTNPPFIFIFLLSPFLFCFYFCFIFVFFYSFFIFRVCFCFCYYCCVICVYVYSYIYFPPAGCDPSTGNDTIYMRNRGACFLEHKLPLSFSLSLFLSPSLFLSSSPIRLFRLIFFPPTTFKLYLLRL